MGRGFDSRHLHQTTKPPLRWFFCLVEMARMRNRVPGSKKLSGTIFNVRLMHGPEGVSPMDGTNNPAISAN